MTTRTSMIRAGMHSTQADAVLGTILVGATATGSTQATAFSIANSNTTFATVAASTGAVLPAAAQAGDEFWVANLGANSLSVYPPLGSGINSLSANAAQAVAAGKCARIKKVSETLWLCIVGS